MFSVFFYAFSKKHNSTALPVSGAVEIPCALKDNTSILNPTLEIEIINNPATYTYAYIPDFNRYYFVSDWKYIIGRWECELSVDVLGTYKTVIGNSEKYVLRSAKAYNYNIIDNFYPCRATETEIAQEYDFGFDIDNGEYVVGIVNREQTDIGGITSYYRMTEGDIQSLRQMMYPTASETFESINGITGDVLRSILNPWQYIQSCKKFPISIPYDVIMSNVKFGQWSIVTPVGANRLLDISNWYTLSHDFVIANDWVTRDAKYRSSPYVRIYLVVNPWGVIELSPSDFIATNTIRIKIKPDFITGDAILQVFSVKGPLETLVNQRVANIGIETGIAGKSVNISGAISAGLSAVGNVFRGSAEGIISAAGNVVSAADSLVPSLQGSTGIMESMRGLDGIAHLIVRGMGFANENNNEFGKPLYDVRTLNTLSADSGNSGYIKCADGEIDISCFDDERIQIESYLTKGFFYE